MFAECEWDEEQGPGKGAQQRSPKRSPKGPPRGNTPAPRHLLLATLRRLEGLGPPPGEAPGTPSSSDREEELEEEGGAGGLKDPEDEPSRRVKKRRRTRRLQGQKEKKEQLLHPPGDDENVPLAHSSLYFCPSKAATASPLMAEKKDGTAKPSADSKNPRTEEGAAKESPGQPMLTRKQWRNRQKNKRRQKNKFKAPGEQRSDPGGEPGDHSQPPVAEEPPSSPEEGETVLSESIAGRAASLRLRMAERLEAARFRYLNEQLYTLPSRDAVQLFQQDPEAFAIYHRGFARQMARWPEKPVQRLVRYLRNRPASLVVADFGCGDCTLARNLRNRVHCFDLVALDPRVTVCDMAQVPLEGESVDVAVFCLALMGTNVQEVLAEASRVLRMGGTLLVAEVASRFPDIRAFVGALARLGFALRSKDLSGSHFYTFEFAKVGPLPAKTKPLPGLALRPCLYKRR
ncbi:ribosomal RNA-processing protein 8 [Sceloporus undulatus]|uniref:ribosomal RNA-processing protein 8 n=1 Tax=Sceloporus undulatus TaxID=8520 RepID=UPI001C4CF187|nr:ribosomal RNA-processing protein 8 [Sceloporus undulatus]